jgi:endogenous inhibitor of DNA gyrase (YacG/DUF329 family)
MRDQKEKASQGGAAKPELKCPKCGNERIKEHFKFCPICGKQLRDERRERYLKESAEIIDVARLRCRSDAEFFLTVLPLL